jgi:heptosyltransferase I
LKFEHSVTAPLRVLVVKLSSLGDVVHTLPAVMDIQTHFPNAHIDWVVEPGFAPIVKACSAVHRVIACDLRHWRKNIGAAGTRLAWRAFMAELHQERYDAILDLQGLTKSALVSWLARPAHKGKRYAMAHATDGSAYERPTRWVADVAIDLEPHVHAMTRGRLLCAKALQYEVPAQLQYGLHPSINSHAIDQLQASQDINDQQRTFTQSNKNLVVFVHGTSRADKEWPLANWHALGLRLSNLGYQVALPHGSEEERLRSVAMAEMIPNAIVWPRMSIDGLMHAMASTAGVIGVDSGLSHIAVALNLPHVQIYNFDTAWRTGPIANGNTNEKMRQRSVVDFPTPSVDAVWSLWLECIA